MDSLEQTPLLSSNQAPASPSATSSSSYASKLPAYLIYATLSVLAVSIALSSLLSKPVNKLFFSIPASSVSSLSFLETGYGETRIEVIHAPENNNIRIGYKTLQVWPPFLTPVIREKNEGMNEVHTIVHPTKWMNPLFLFWKPSIELTVFLPLDLNDFTAIGDSLSLIWSGPTQSKSFFHVQSNRGNINIMNPLLSSKVSISTGTGAIYLFNITAKQLSLSSTFGSIRGYINRYENLSVKASGHDSGVSLRILPEIEASTATVYSGKRSNIQLTVIGFNGSFQVTNPSHQMQYGGVEWPVESSDVDRGYVKDGRNGKGRVAIETEGANVLLIFEPTASIPKSIKL